MIPARRVREVAPYPFAALGARARVLEQSGRRVANLSIGDPDRPPPPRALEALGRHARMPGTHRYPESHGSHRFREAVAHYYARRFGVSLDPEREVVGLIGSKEGLAHLIWAFSEEGTVTLVPDPAYPVYAAHTQFAGGEVVRLPLRPECKFLPDLGAIAPEVLDRARLLVLNYPNAPTGAVAPPTFWEEAIALAERHGLLLVNDGAYLDVCLDPALPAHESLLRTPGAIETAVEFFSLSKTYHMTGWRLAAAVGNAQALLALRVIKENTDSGQWTPLQLTAAELLEDPDMDAYVDAENARLRWRLDLLVDALRAAGCPVQPPAAALYLWIPIPVAFGQDDDRFAEILLTETGILATPGRAFGEGGKGYVRFSLTAADEEIDRAARILRAQGLPGLPVP